MQLRDFFVFLTVQLLIIITQFLNLILMIKRAGIILLGTLFLALSLNIRFDLHYCHDELTEISFSHDEEHCGGMMSNDCNSCKDVHVEFENDQDQISQTLKYN